MNTKSETKEKDNKVGAKVLNGVVVSSKMKDTAVVEVVRYVKHPKYKKYYKVNKRYKAHDVGNKAEVGQKVGIRSVRPISKDKHFVIVHS